VTEDEHGRKWKDEMDRVAKKAAELENVKLADRITQEIKDYQTRK